MEHLSADMGYRLWYAELRSVHKIKALRKAGGDVMLSIGGATTLRWLLPVRT